MCSTTLPHIELEDSFFSSSSSGKPHSLAQIHSQSTKKKNAPTHGR